MPAEHELMEHERMRWDSITVRQLRTRVSRIRNPTKLRCFARMCEERSNNYLATAAVERASQLGVIPFLPVVRRVVESVQPVDRSWVCSVCGTSNDLRWGECAFCKRGAEQKTKERAEEAEKKKRKGVRLIRFKEKSSLDK